MANFKKQYLKGEGEVMEMPEPLLEVIKLVRYYRFSKHCRCVCQPCKLCSAGKEMELGSEGSDPSRKQMTG